jgi:site-specific DNA-methyltransferase (adenine-specific)
MKQYYEHDGCTIYHGDCREVLPTLEQISAVVTDPPYQLANGRKANTMGKTANRSGSGNLLKGTYLQNRDYGAMVGGDEPFEPSMFLGFREVILWGAIHYATELPNATKWLVWDKREGVEIDDNADCEMAWTNLKGPARIFRNLWKGVYRKGEENISVAGAKLHPFQKPVELMRWCICKLKYDGIVLDPFMGSGTTLRAAKDLGRRAIGIEIEERYCEIAAKRLAQGVFAFDDKM